MNEWDGKLVTKNGNFPNETQRNIIENYFQRHEIFEHKFNVNDIFNRFYKVLPQNSKMLKPKRQPNAFMMLRAVFGLVANDKHIKSKIGDGAKQSKLASFIWGGASDNEKNIFFKLCEDFKKLHKKLYPDYKVKNARRKRFNFEINTPESYQKSLYIPKFSINQMDLSVSFSTTTINQIERRNFSTALDLGVLIYYLNYNMQLIHNSYEHKPELAKLYNSNIFNKYNY